MNEDKGILIVLGDQNLSLGEAQYFFRQVAVCPFYNSPIYHHSPTISTAYITNWLYIVNLRSISAPCNMLCINKESPALSRA